VVDVALGDASGLFIDFVSFLPQILMCELLIDETSGSFIFVCLGDVHFWV
jgi:hypothetical protein